MLWVGTRSLEQAHSSLGEASAAVRRNLAALLIWMGFCVGFALLHLHLTTPEYIASVRLVLEPGHQAQDGPELIRMFHQMELDSQQAQTQLHLIRSVRLLRYVFDNMDLIQAPELSGRRPHRDPPDQAERARAFSEFASRVVSRRLGLSYVIEIAYRAPDPKRAARIANAIAAAYLRERIATAVEDAQVGIPYLKSRIDGILNEELVAAGAVRTGTVPESNFPDADIRLLGPAIVPGAPAFPKAAPIMILAVGFGLLSGLVGIALLHRADRRIRSKDQLARRLGLQCLSVIEAGGRTRLLGLFGRRGGRNPPDAGLRYGLRTIHAALVAQRGSRPLRSIGFVSWSEGETCRIVASGLASMVAASGARTVLLDLDRPSPQSPQDASGPILSRDTGALLRSRSLPGLAVLALPALETSLEPQAYLPMLDATILVVEGNRTTTTDISAALGMLQAVGARLMGLVLVEDAARTSPILPRP